MRMTSPSLLTVTIIATVGSKKDASTNGERLPIDSVIVREYRVHAFVVSQLLG